MCRRDDNSSRISTHISVPSPVYKSESNNVLFVGGFKASVNIEFLTSKNVGLIVNACPTIEAHFGRKVAELFKKRRQQLPHVKEGTIMSNVYYLCDVMTFYQQYHFFGTSE